MAEREIELLERELSMMMIQQERAAAAATPTPKKRKGKFKKSRLRLLKRDGGHHSISMPTGNAAFYMEFNFQNFNYFNFKNFLNIILFYDMFQYFVDFRHNITIQLTPSRAELNRLQVEMQNG